MITEHRSCSGLTAGEREEMPYLFALSLSTWLFSAAAVTVLRFLNVAELGYDLTLQIQAAQNLLVGKGLAVYTHAGPDLAEPAKPFTLTYFPCGYSLCAAALMALGAGPGTVVKILGAAGTMLGWWGWGKLARALFSDGSQQSSVWRWAGLVIAILTPLRFTPQWQGTDILLWAAVPWVLIWGVRASDEQVRGAWRFDWLAGAVCGICILMRYAALFLAAYAAFLILWQSRTHFLRLVRRWSFFGLGLLPFVALQLYINAFLSRAPVRPGGVTFDRGLSSTAQHAWEEIASLGAASYAWLFWLPGRVVDILMDSSMPWAVLLTLFICIWLVLVIRVCGLDISAAARDPRTAAAGLFIVLPLSLWGCSMIGDFAYGAIERYYWPIIPLAILLVYSLASHPGFREKTRFTRMLRALVLIYVVGYVITSLAGIALFFAPGERGSYQRTMVLGSSSDFRHWPSFAVTYDFSAARAFALRQLEQQPGALLLSSKYQWFSADPAVDLARLSEIDCDSLETGYLSGPAHVVVFTFDRGRPEELWYPSRGRLRRAECFERLPEPDLVRHFPEEGLKVLATRIPQGAQVVLRPRDEQDGF